MNYLLKSKYALYSAIVFFLFANPDTYHMTQGFFGSFLHIATNDCPTVYGVFFHTGYPLELVVPHVLDRLLLQTSGFYLIVFIYYFNFISKNEK